ncbi:MAG: hypothetical protein RMK97_00555 [Sutterellaceae bacterium]|nr:hypothetical protein [Burkholderiaceae bacterium]MCX7901864.1 hypothetical protein [Burkholderiaceae bacterium]MDW8428991.1 hypothetical protein [Sutterellaceae bacterium]
MLAKLKRHDIGRLNTAHRYAARQPEQKPVDGERSSTLYELFAPVAATGCEACSMFWRKLTPALTAELQGRRAEAFTVDGKRGSGYGAAQRYRA